MISPAQDACSVTPTLSRNGGGADRYDLSVDCEGRARHPNSDGSVIVGCTVVNSWDWTFLVSAARVVLAASA